ncbi:MAG: hypothetical protein JO134_12260 [Xanthobacteraceae bacterium]|nr:hypothetical protein [Xanthobacteraceae bacterium]
MFKLHPALAIAVIVCSLAICAVPAKVIGAQNQAPASAPADLPPDQDLDALLLAKKWNDLASALSRAKSSDSIVRMLDWLRSRLDAGGGSLLGFIYAKDLWDIGEAQKGDDPNKDLRLTAGLITLYTYELIAIDGAKCADHSAPSHRVDQLLMNNAPALAYLKAQPQELKDKVVDLAIAMEKKTAPLRKLDDLLCRSGLAEMQAGIAAGKTREVPTPPGQVGKTIEVDPPADFAPRLLTPQSYLPDQERARANMRATLLKLIQ